MSSSLSIQYVPKATNAATVPDLWLKLEQRAIPKHRQFASFALINAMFTQAMTGGSARSFVDQGCPATIDGGVVSIPLSVYVFPSAMGLPYKLKAATGRIGAPVAVTVERSFDVTIDFQQVIELPGIIQGATITNLTGCYNDRSEEVACPEIEIDGPLLKVSESVFTVVRIRGLMEGYEHSLTMEIVKSEAAQGDEDQRVGYRIENLTNSVQATWLDENGDQQDEYIEIEIPECVKAMLEVCATGELLGNVTVTHADEEQYTEVYYNTCVPADQDNVIAVIHREPGAKSYTGN